jgi:uncharacterized protein (TIGR03067 family)
MRGFALALLLLGAGAVVAAETPAEKANKTDRANLQGTWTVKSVHGFTKEKAKEELAELKLTFEGDTLSARWGDKSAEATYTLNAAGDPRQIDVTLTKGPEEVQGRLFRGIYSLEGNTLRLAWRKAGEERPKEFVREGQPEVFEIFLEKMKK